MEEIIVSLNEPNFTFLCKNGHLVYGSGYDKKLIDISRMDMISLSKGEEIIKELFDINKKFTINIQGVESDMIKEIIRRSPIYSQIYYEI